MSVASVGRRSHQHAHELDFLRPRGELHRDCAAGCTGDISIGKRDPVALRLIADGVVASPVLDLVIHGVGIGPGDFDGINGQGAAKVDDDPAGMERVVFVGEHLVEIGVALPISCEVAVVEHGVAAAGAVIARGSAVRKVVSERTFVRTVVRTLTRRADEIALLIRRIAPGAVGIPMPRLNGKLSVQAIADRAPSGGKHLLHVRWIVENAGRIQRIAIDRRAERAQRTVRIGGVAGGNVDSGLLGDKRQNGRKGKYCHNGNSETF